MRFSDRLLDRLKQAGWNEGRSSFQNLHVFQTALGDVLHSTAYRVLLEFAGLDIGRRVFFEPYYATLALRSRQLLPPNFRETLCPVALTTYWSDTTVWIDENGRVFLLEPDELSYLAASMDAALEILVLDGKPEPVPQELHPGHWDIENSDNL
ncbi:MAG TPA: SUKH-3 domain-containing protein [Prosthecobacter sp.]|nr:SUKH-3 domain-containing protein [Prosthecobacter sp.]HRK16431.1 SUKH-3 domain-containing protein [Prosthecobacter sp.]